MVQLIYFEFLDVSNRAYNIRNVETVSGNNTVSKTDIITVL